jgi:hypothetical protein
MWDVGRYTVAYVDFFDGQVKAHEGAWTKVLEEYLYSGAEPLINGFTGGRKFLYYRQRTVVTAGYDRTADEE